MSGKQKSDDQDRQKKISRMQMLVSEGLASGVSEKSMSDILYQARLAVKGA